jgi:DNA-binding NarL/FixJ family response regulator
MMSVEPLKPRSATEKTRIVLVDDHDVVRRGLVSLITADPTLDVCGEADSVSGAVEVLQRTHPDLVLVDMSLKDGDGLDLLKRISTEFPNVLALVLSMYDESVYAERALRAGARGYVRKIDVAGKILIAIRKVLAGEIYLNEEIASTLLNRLSPGKRAESQAPVERLSDRELQVLRAIGQGLSNREIAEQLFISVKTVESHREHIKEKLRLGSSGELLRYAIEFGRVKDH